ncbi:SDR family NAD(P)-dependent oxidoreductase, partial [Pimelobacter simplex]
MTDKWNVADLPDQTGRTIVVTGPTLGGLGHHTALELARRGARVILAGRNPAKVEETVGAIRAEVPDASLEALHLDLASLGSV